MQVVNYFESNRQAHWLEEIKRSDWSAGAFLFDLISKGLFFDAVGEESKVLLLTEGDELLSLRTLPSSTSLGNVHKAFLVPWNT